VFAIPGSIHSPLSKGPHRLIRDGAKLVETAQDVLSELGLAAATAPAAPARAGDAQEAIGDDARAVLDALGGGPVEFDRIVTRSGLKPETIAALLVELELAGRASPLPGGRWQRRGA
jgi:DNA processing protein